MQRLGTVSEWRSVVGGPRVVLGNGLRIAAAVRNLHGTGPLWHAATRSLYWFDLTRSQLFRLREDGEVAAMALHCMASAAALVDASTLLVIADDGFYIVDLGRGTLHPHMGLEDDNLATRSGCGRVDPWGRFWVATLGRDREPGAGTLYRLAGVRLEILKQELTAPNAIAFSPDRRRAYFAEGASRSILVFELDPETGAIRRQRVFATLDDAGSLPCGAAVDAEGFLWNAQAGASRVVRYRPDGAIDRVVELPVDRPTGVSFGGGDLKTLFITTACDHLDKLAHADQPHAGALLALDVEVPGQAENAMH